MSRPLEGIRVLDFSIMIAGPYAGRLLADAGAEVLKIESPQGDPMRQRTPLREGESSYFGALNAGKRSVMLDLKSAESRAQARELIATADVLLENFRPGVMSKFGLGHEAVRKDHPNLVYCSISGYGQSGPRATDPAYAPILHATSGYDLANMGYQLDAARPAATGTFVADVMAGQAAYAGILTALMGRERTGEGSYVDVALMDIMLSTLVYETQAAQAADPGPAKTVYRPMPVGDEYMVIAVITDRNFRNLVEVLDSPSLATDSRFATMSGREHHWEDFLGVIADWVKDKDPKALEQLLLSHGIPCARFRTVAEALRDEQVVARGTMWQGIDSAGSFDYVGPPFQIPGMAPTGAVPVPALGEWTRAAGVSAAADSVQVPG